MAVRRRKPPQFRPLGSRAKSRLSFAGIVGRAIAALGLAWVVGLLWFSLALPQPAPLTAHTDAVVVLTGGGGRLARGLAVVDAGAAPRLLFSGVGRATRAQIAEANGVKLTRLKDVDLGYEAVDTRSNAEETARWVAKNGFKSIRLVTSAGHMRRARLELSAILPGGIAILPDSVPVEPDAPGIATEYTKYLLRLAARTAGAD